MAGRVLGIIVVLLIAVYQVPPLLQNKQYRELLGFGLIWFTAVIYISLVLFGFPLPTVVEVLVFMYDLIPLPFVSGGSF